MNEHLAYFLLDLLLIFLIISKFKLMHTKWFTNLHVMEPFHIKLLAFFAVLLWFPVFNQHFWEVFYPKKCLKLNEIKTITPLIFSLRSVYRRFLLQCPKLTQTMSVTSALQFSMWKNEMRKRKRKKNQAESKTMLKHCSLTQCCQCATCFSTLPLRAESLARYLDTNILEAVSG